MNSKSEALLVLGGALVLGALCQYVARTEAAALGLSPLQLAVLGLAAGTVVTRVVRPT